MSCANFQSQKDFRLMAWGLDGEDEFEFENMKDNFDAIVWSSERKRPLKFFELKLQSGYFEGVQILVERAKFIWDGNIKENPHELNNEDCQYWYNECRSKLIRQYDSEVKYINNKLLPWFKELGFIELAISARFSNGETCYSKVA